MLPYSLISDQLHCDSNTTRAVGVELREQPIIMSYQERKQNCYYKIFKNTWKYGKLCLLLTMACDNSCARRTARALRVVFLV